jgi:hypothetical protein
LTYSYLEKIVGVIIALTGKKMLLVILKSEEPPENSKTSRGPFKA